MAQFDALREGFRELNRMLVDKQQWEERHKADAADRQFKNVMLQNNLEQQAFQREMQKKSHLLAVKGEGRAADMFANKVVQQGVQAKIKADEIAETARHRTAIEGDSERNSKANVMRALSASLTDVETRKRLASQQEKLDYDSEEVELNFSNTLTEGVLTSPDELVELNAEAGLRGIRVNPDGTATDLEGVPITSKRYAQADMHEWVGALGEKYENTEVRSANAIQQLQAGLADVQSKKREINPDSGRGQFHRAELARAENKIKGEIAQTAQIFTVEGKLSNLYNRADNLTARARKLDAYPGGAGAAAGLRADADDLRSQAKEIYDDQQAGRVATAKANKGVAPKGEMTEDQMYNEIDSRYSTVSPLGTMIIGEKLKPKIATVKGYATRLYNISGKSGALRQDAANTADEVINREEGKYRDKIARITGRDKLTAYTNTELIAFLNVVSPNYKGKTTVGAVRRHLLNTKKQWYGKQLRSLPGADPLMPIYLPIAGK